ncbi:MAG: LURP-one-related/scramblase family protein, partial [Ilumatobacteraceae bacterium]
MGLRDRRRGDDGPAGRRYKMQEKLLSIGDDYWIEDEGGERVFKVDGKAVRVRDTFVLEDSSGNEVAKIQERKVNVRNTMKIEMEGRSATVKKAVVGVRDRYKIDVDGGPDFSAHGNVVDHEYEIERDGDTVATVSKGWFRVRDTYGVEITPEQDDALILSITVCMDSM